MATRNDPQGVPERSALKEACEGAEGRARERRDSGVLYVLQPQAATSFVPWELGVARVVYAVAAT